MSTLFQCLQLRPSSWVTSAGPSSASRRRRRWSSSASSTTPGPGPTSSGTSATGSLSQVCQLFHFPLVRKQAESLWSIISSQIVCLWRALVRQRDREGLDCSCQSWAENMARTISRESGHISLSLLVWIVQHISCRTGKRKRNCYKCSHPSKWHNSDAGSCNNLVALSSPSP